jgi:hypothetical protein
MSELHRTHRTCEPRPFGGPAGCRRGCILGLERNRRLLQLLHRHTVPPGHCRQLHGGIIQQLLASCRRLSQLAVLQLLKACLAAVPPALLVGAAHALVADCDFIKRLFGCQQGMLVLSHKRRLLRRHILAEGGGIRRTRSITRTPALALRHALPRSRDSGHGAATGGRGEEKGGDRKRCEPQQYMLAGHEAGCMSGASGIRGGRR